MTIRGEDWIRNHLPENARYFSLCVQFRKLIRPGLPGPHFEFRAATRPVLYVFPEAKTIPTVSVNKSSLANSDWILRGIIH